MPKAPTKQEASKAARVLGSDSAGPRAKKAASKVLTEARAQKAAIAKKAASRAGRTLASSTASGKQKSTAGAVLARGGRVVKSPKGKGTIKPATIRKAVKNVAAKRSKTGAR